MEDLRKPFLIAAIALMAVVVLVEVGATAVLGDVQAAATDVAALVPPSGEVRDAFDDLDEGELDEALSTIAPRPGRALPALVDGLLLFTMALIGGSLVWRERLHARIQGCATLVFTVLVIVGAIALILVALALLLVMIALFLAVPFGTLAYLAIYGFFNRGGAAAALGLLMALKLAAAICLVLAQQRFLQNRGLVLLILTSVVANVVVGFLHGLVPGFLVSITDAVAAIVVGVLAVIWALVFLIGAVPAVLRALRPGRS